MSARKLFAILSLSVAFAAGCNLPRSAGEAMAFDHYAIGQVLAESGDMDAALAELLEAIRCDPELSVAHAAIGDIHRKRGSHRLAVGAYQNACRVNPYAFRPHYNLGVTYQALAQAAQAVEAYTTYLKEAVNVYLRAVIIREDDFDANLNLSACYFQLGKYDMAEEYCTVAIALNPKSPQAHSNLGIIYDSQNRLYKAIRAYKDSLEIDTNQPKILLNLGSTYMRQGLCKAALSPFRLAAKQDPKDPAPFRQLGECYYRLKQYEKAVESYQQAISLDPRDASALRGLGTVHITQYVLARDNGQLRDLGLAAWRRSLEIEPEQQDLIKLVAKYTPKDINPEL
ncbi:MAG: tetratricopeptide repeat protein [Phycisphaerae bacterium]|nr:tetratricopeptide repeat protein [Planctomycetota bacterium]MBL7219711.1 tetratricopeptide repeat protein [Phycisphaerae bacterium]